MYPRVFTKEGSCGAPQNILGLGPLKALIRPCLYRIVSEIYGDFGRKAHALSPIFNAPSRVLPSEFCKKTSEEGLTTTLKV